MQEVWIMDAQRFASSASTAHPFGRSLRTGRRVRAGKFLQACPNGDPGEPGRFGHAAHTSSSQGTGFYRCPRTAGALIQEWPQDDKLCCNGLACWVLHRADRNTLIREMDRLFWRASLGGAGRQRRGVESAELLVVLECRDGRMHATERAVRIAPDAD